MKRPSIVALACALFIAPALAQTPQSGRDIKPMTDLQARLNAAPDASLPTVSSLSCEQMAAELAVAGARMKGQLDPGFAANAETLRKEATTPRAAPPTADEVAKNHARVNQVATQLVDSTQGIDMQRMMALTTEFSTRKCETPQ